MEYLGNAFSWPTGDKPVINEHFVKPFSLGASLGDGRYGGLRLMANGNGELIASFCNAHGGMDFVDEWFFLVTEEELFQWYAAVEGGHDIVANALAFVRGHGPYTAPGRNSFIPPEMLERSNG